MLGREESAEGDIEEQEVALTPTNSAPQDRLYPITTRLVEAVKKGEADDTRTFLQQGADAHCRLGRFQESLLHIAAEKGYTQVARILIEEARVKIDLREQAFQFTPLLSAAHRGHLEMLNLLIEHGADVNVRDHMNGTPLHFASVENDKLQERRAVIDRLLEAGARINPLDTYLLPRTPLDWATDETIQQYLRERGGRKAWEIGFCPLM
ncbi:MAG: ankyrin repeat domain-containing protein [Roseivirga sp.]